MAKTNSIGGKVSSFFKQIRTKSRITKKKQKSKYKSHKSNTDQCDKLRKCDYKYRKKRID